MTEQRDGLGLKLTSCDDRTSEAMACSFLLKTIRCGEILVCFSYLLSSYKFEQQLISAVRELLTFDGGGEEEPVKSTSLWLIDKAELLRIESCLFCGTADLS